MKKIRITKTKTTAKPKPISRIAKRRLRRTHFKPRYDQIAAFNDRSIDKVAQKMNAWLKDFAYEQKAKGDMYGRHFTQVMPILSNRPGSFIGQILYSVEL